MAFDACIKDYTDVAGLFLIVSDRREYIKFFDWQNFAAKMEVIEKCKTKYSWSSSIVVKYNVSWP